MRFQNIDAQCVFCEFFECSWTRNCLGEVRAWLGWECKNEDFRGLIRWFQRRKMSRFRFQLYVAGLSALVYNIWRMRNLNIWAEEKVDKARVIFQVKKSVKNRGRLITCKKIDKKEEDWFHTL